MAVSLGIDYGAKYIGLALLEQTAGQRPVVRYAACIVAEPLPLKDLVVPRAQLRRLRRTRKTHRRRLRRLAAALRGIAGAETILRFCRRRGYSHHPKRAWKDLPPAQTAGQTVGASGTDCGSDQAGEQHARPAVARLERAKEQVYQELLEWVQQAARVKAGRKFAEDFLQYQPRKKRKARAGGEPKQQEQQQEDDQDESGDQQEEQEGLVFDVSREDFFRALEAEIERVIAEPDRARVLAACRKHLNARRIPTAELRPPRFDNRAVTRCRWEGCRRRPPRVHNATLELLRQTLYVRLKPVFDEALERLDAAAAADKKQQMCRQVDDWCRRLARLAAEYGNLPADARPAISARGKNRGFREQLDELVIKGRSGRLAYCREHSRQFVEYFLGGKQIPNRTDVADRDVRSRRQKILFDRLWSLIRGRLLPLVGGRIDRIVVERVAFDILAGKLKKRQELLRDKENNAYQMYWYGPGYGFTDQQEMLRKEFGGCCAYCGQKAADLEADHILPRRKFPFDSYLVLVPACRQCNMRKGGRSISEAGMCIERRAYGAYNSYVRRLGVPHYFQTVKKGLLNLLSIPGRTWQGERLLGMLADNLLTMAESQKAVRPLGRWLAGKLEAHTGVRPEVKASSGRHTAVYRKVVLPQYDKAQEKEAQELRNHAVDAIMLACDFPAVTLIDGKWWLPEERLSDWEQRVKATAPELAAVNGNGSALQVMLPKVASPQPVKFFEQDLGGGYFAIKLSAFGWNRARQSGTLVDPVGVTRDGSRVLKRKPAQNVFQELLRQGADRDKQIKAIAHRGLRKVLQDDPDNAARNFVRWLQAQTARGLRAAQMSSHPADQQRRQILEQFVKTPVERFFAPPPEKTDAKPSATDGAEGASGKKKSLPPAAQIPPVIGVRCLIDQSPKKYDVFRCDLQKKLIHRYASQPGIREIYVGYKRGKNGQLELAKPVVLQVNQIWRVYYGKPGADQESKKASEFTRIYVEGTPLEGRPLGTRGSGRDFRQRWREALQQVWKQLGVEKVWRIRQGAVIEKTDGSCSCLLNFNLEEPWMRGSPWRDIRRVYRSPMHYLACQARAPGAKGQTGEGPCPPAAKLE